MSRIVCLVILAYALVACKGSGSKDGIHYGAEITADGAISITEVLAKIDAGDGATDFDAGDGNMVKAIATKVEGKVSDVCLAAGCWLNIATEDGTKIFITTNHNFFVPTDIVGKTVVIDGDAFKSIISVAERQHYAEDEGKSAEEIAKITEPESKYQILAKGLVIKQ